MGATRRTTRDMLAELKQYVSADTETEDQKKKREELNRKCAEIEESVWTVLRNRYVMAGGLPGEVYHYTNAAAFQSILTDGEAWATDSRALNDPEDGEEATRLFDGIVRMDYSNDAPERQSLIEALRLKHAGMTRMFIPRFSRLFVSSFSGHENDIGQWRIYADDGRGISFGIRPAQLSVIPSAFWGKVIYNGSDQVNLLNEMIDDVATRFRALDDAAGEPIGTHAMPAAHTAERLVGKVRAFFKNDAYSLEKEWRLARLVGFREDESKFVRVRERGGQLVPYTPLKIVGADGLIPLSEVLVGPAVRSNLSSLIAVQDLLSQRGYFRKQVGLDDELLEVDFSNIPYRSSR